MATTKTQKNAKATATNAKETAESAANTVRSGAKALRNRMLDGQKRVLDFQRSTFDRTFDAAGALGRRRWIFTLNHRRRDRGTGLRGRDRAQKR